MYGATHGLGFLIATSGARFQTDKVMVGIILIAAAGIALTELLRLIEAPLRTLAAERGRLSRSALGAGVRLPLILAVMRAQCSATRDAHADHQTHDCRRDADRIDSICNRAGLADAAADHGGAVRRRRVERYPRAHPRAAPVGATWASR